MAKKPSAKKATAQARRPSRSYGPRSLAAAVERVIRPAVKRRGLAETTIITRWNEIVGDKLAAHSIPERLVPGRGRDGGGVLHMRVAGPWALEIQHLEPQLIDRINGFLGRGAVARLRLHQGPLPTRPARQAEADRKPRPRAGDEDKPEADLAGIEAGLAGIEDGELRRALAALGRAVADAPTKNRRRR